MWTVNLSKSYLDQWKHKTFFRLVVAGSPEVEVEGKSVRQRPERPCRRVGEGCLWDLSWGLH